MTLLPPDIQKLAERPGRVLSLANGHNFRDLGGYPAAGGRLVRWRRLYRSGVMSRITGEDAAQLHELGIDSICDLRTNDERARKPTRWHEGATDRAVELWARDYEHSGGALAQIIRKPEASAERMHQAMVKVYRKLPFEQVDSFRELFRRVLGGRLPLVFNCSAGKDRTGVAAALLLSAVGVPRIVVEADYLLTNDWVEELAVIMAGEPKYGEFVNSRRDLALPLLRAEPDYLETMFATLDERHGSTEGYLREAIGLRDEDFETLRHALLE